MFIIVYSICPGLSLLEYSHLARRTGFTSYVDQPGLLSTHLQGTEDCFTTAELRYVAVPCRNRRLFRRVFRSHRCVQSAVSLNFREGRRSYALRRLFRYSCIYEARMSPTLNGSSAIRRFEHSDTIEIRDGITFDFYMGLPHVYVAMVTGV